MHCAKHINSVNNSSQLYPLFLYLNEFIISDLRDEF